MDDERRSLMRRVAATVGAMSLCSRTVAASPGVDSGGRMGSGYLHLRDEFHAAGDGKSDDTEAFQAAIDAGSRRVTPVAVPPGVYRITRSLTVPPNTMLVGSAPGLGFGCRLEPVGCAAFIIGGARPSFHSSIEDLMIWPRGEAPAYVIAIDNSYSVRLRNLRIHNAQADLGRAAVVLLGDAAAGGHGPCNDIIWDNLIIRNDAEQSPIAVLAASGCGSHRFISPCLENYNTLFEWQGGQIDVITPYTERAGRFGFHCNTSTADAAAFLNTFGGVVNCAQSGVACAIRTSSGVFNSFGTQWGGDGSRAAFVYSVPRMPVIFHGIAPNLTTAGRNQFGGVTGWRQAVRFPDASLQQAMSLSFVVAPGQQLSVRARVPGVRVGEHSVRVVVGVDLRGLQLSGYVDSTDGVTVTAYNPSRETVTIDGMGHVLCDLI